MDQHQTPTPLTHSTDGSKTEGTDQLAFRRTLGYLATGITVLTLYSDDGVYGMTANAVTSVSLDPPLILVCLDRKTRMARYVQTSCAFGVNVLTELQEPLSRFFARSWHAPEPPEHRFEEWAGVPYLVGSLSALSCRVTEIFEGGDHIIVLARVVGLRVDEPEGRPLLYYRGRYASLEPHEASPPQSPELISSDQIRAYYGEWAHEENDPTPPPTPPWLGD